MFRQRARGLITPRSEPTTEFVAKSTTVQAALAAAAATSNRGSDTALEPAGITNCAPTPAAVPASARAEVANANRLSGHSTT